MCRLHCPATCFCSLKQHKLGGTPSQSKQCPLLRCDHVALCCVAGWSPVDGQGGSAVVTGFPVPGAILSPQGTFLQGMGSEAAEPPWAALPVPSSLQSPLRATACSDAPTLAPPQCPWPRHPNLQGFPGPSPRFDAHLLSSLVRACFPCAPRGPLPPTNPASLDEGPGAPRISLGQNKSSLLGPVLTCLCPLPCEPLLPGVGP